MESDLAVNDIRLLVLMVFNRITGNMACCYHVVFNDELIEM